MRGIPSPFIKIYERGRDTPHWSAQSYRFSPTAAASKNSVTVSAAKLVVVHCSGSSPSGFTQVRFAPRASREGGGTS